MLPNGPYFSLPCSLPFNFAHVYITQNGTRTDAKGQISSSYTIDKTRTRVGHGKHDYQTARTAMLTWQHFHFDWAFTNAPKVKRGEAVVIAAQSLMLWTLNPLRITTIEDDVLPSGREEGRRVKRRTAFAHTTLQGHQISGEERFSVDWMRDDDSVWYEVLTVSRPATPIAALARPVLRFYQRKFVKESTAVMQQLIRKARHD
jgi:uncharacterized protein (UPF0548 family)